VRDGDCEACDHGIATLCDDCASDEVASKVSDWLVKERAKPATDITPEIAAIFERCSEDLR